MSMLFETMLDTHSGSLQYLYEHSNAHVTRVTAQWSPFRARLEGVLPSLCLGGGYG